MPPSLAIEPATSPAQAWGIAYVLGPNINAPMDSASGVAAHAAITRAAGLQSAASPSEGALIAALATRYEPVPAADRARPHLCEFAELFCTQMCMISTMEA